MEKLDLSDNYITVKTLLDLSSWMSSKALSSKLVLRNLKISGNKLGDDSLLVLCKGLNAANPNLKELDLSKNMMADYSATELSKFLAHSQTMEVLNLSWNRITSYGGTNIFEGLREGRSCRSVNISYNSLGKQESFLFVEAFQLAVNEDNIKHVDLSYNRMKKAVCDKLGKLIIENHTLYGIHLEGNE